MTTVCLRWVPIKILINRSPYALRGQAIVARVDGVAINVPETGTVKKFGQWVGFYGEDWGSATISVWESDLEGVLDYSKCYYELWGNVNTKYYFVYNLLKVGTHTITLRGYNPSGDMFVATTTVIILPDESLKITSPSSGAQFFTGENIQFISTASMNLVDFHWSCDGFPLGTSPNSPITSAANLSPGTHTIKVSAQNASNSSEVSDSIIIGVQDAVSEIKISNLDVVPGEDPFSENAVASYRAAKTRFQAVGYRADGSEIGPVSAEWCVYGGDVIASEQLKMGILSQLDQPNTRIGNLDSGQYVVASASTVTFNSFLPGNLTLTAKRGNASDSVAIRIKQPTFKVNVYPVGDVDTSIFDTWKNVVNQVWEKEGIIKVESVDLMPAISNVTYPDPPLIHPPEGSEASMETAVGLNPSYLNPLYYDYLLGENSGFFITPRTTDFLISRRFLGSVNIFVVRRPISHWSDSSYSPPIQNWNFPDIVTVSGRNYFFPVWTGGAIVRENLPPYPVQYSRFLAAGVGNLFGLPRNAEWMNNLMDFTQIGGLAVTPEQYVSALNYRGDNPESSNFIFEE